MLVTGVTLPLTVFGQFMKNIYDDENITDVTEEDLFEFSDIKVKMGRKQNELMRNQLDLLNPEQNIDDEEFLIMINKVVNNIESGVKARRNFST